MPTLDKLLTSKFESRLAKCEANRNQLHEFDRKVVRGLRDKFDSRSTAEELNCATWNPTRKQWNYLADLAERFRD